MKKIASITGVASYVPDYILGNDELEKIEIPRKLVDLVTGFGAGCLQRKARGDDNFRQRLSCQE